MKALFKQQVLESKIASLEQEIISTLTLHEKIVKIYRDEIIERDEEIEELKKENQKLRDELKEFQKVPGLSEAKGLQQEIELFEYKSYGFPLFIIAYDYTLKYWSCFFRNPAEFSNPDIKEDSPEKAVKKMLQFMRTQQ